MSQPDLLVLAEGLLREGGPEALTMDALATAAGVSRATLYRQVGSREALLTRLAERGVDVGAQGDVRARTLRAAAQVFTRLGFEGTTVEAIAEAAGVGVATVYRHFGDKRGLIKAFLSEHTPRRETWRIAREPSFDLRADLEHIAATLLTHLQTQGDLIRLAVIERTRGNAEMEELAQSPDRTVHAIAALLRTYVERGDLGREDPAQMAQAFMGMIFAFSGLGLFSDPTVSTAAVPSTTARFLVRVFLDGLAAPARRPTKKKRRTP